MPTQNSTQANGQDQTAVAQAQVNQALIAQSSQMRNAQDVVEIDLMELFFVLLSNWKALILGLLVGAVLLGGYQSFFVERSYEASTEIYITSNDSVISLQDLQLGAALTEDYKFIVTSRIVLNQVIDNLQLDIGYDQLKRMITVTNPTGTHIIRTSVKTTDLQLSRDIANDLLNVSVERIYQVVGSNEPTVIDYSQAEAVEEVTPSLFRYMGIGALVGFLLVAAILTIRMLTNTTIRTDEDIEKYLQLPVLAAVPYYEE